MSLSLFSVKTKYYKNGIWGPTRLMTKVFGEDKWDNLRIYRRIWQARIWYARQQFLYECFIEAPEICSLLGAFPKADSSHGFPMYQTYEMYRDFQENTINSDGWFGMWILFMAVIYVIHFFYSYMIPAAWIRNSLKNEEKTRHRMKDAIASVINEECYGMQYAEWAWGPHDFHYNRLRGIVGYRNPDDPRAMSISTFNRKNKYKEHYIDQIGEGHSMTYPL